MKWQRRYKTQCSQIAADVEQRSNQELLQEIERILTASSAADMDTGRLEAYLDILQERAPVMEGYAPEAEWEKTKAQHPLLFEVEPSKCSKKADVRRWFGPIRAVEIAVAVALCLMITVNAFGYNPIKQLLDWADGIIRVYSNPSGEMTLPPDDPSEYHSLAEALEAYGISPDSCPTWIPEDYTIEVVTVRNIKQLLRITGVYSGERGDFLIRATYYKNIGGTDWTNAIERDDGGSVFIVGEREYYIVTNSDQLKVGWIQDSCFYEIIGQISESEAKIILQSISN